MLNLTSTLCRSAVLHALACGHMPHLRELHLGGNMLGDGAMKLLAQCCRPVAFEHLSSLDLSRNAIGPEGADALSNLFIAGIMPSLATLTLSINQLGDLGATALAGALGSIPSLTVCSIDNNTIGDSGMAAFAEAIKGGSAQHLKELFIHQNHSTDLRTEAILATRTRTPVSMDIPFL
eukprot:5692373-Prymnesium_polylepis.2